MVPNPITIRQYTHFAKFCMSEAAECGYHVLAAVLEDLNDVLAEVSKQPTMGTKQVVEALTDLQYIESYRLACDIDPRAKSALDALCTTQHELTEELLRVAQCAFSEEGLM